MDMQQARQQLPALSSLSDADFVDAVQKLYYPDKPRDQIAESLGVQLPKPIEVRPTASVSDRVTDTGLAALSGAVTVPEAAVGLVDMATGGHLGKALANEDGAIGFRPEEAQQILQDKSSAAQKYSNAQVQNAEGFWNTFKAAVSNPATVWQSIVQSMPMMGAGGVIGRGYAAARFTPRMLAYLEGLAPEAREAAILDIQATGGAIGEGATQAGQQAEQVRAEDDQGLITGKNVVGSVASGIGDTIIGRFSGHLANKLGVADVNTMLSGAAVNRRAAQHVVRSALEGMLQEGVLEELPQSIQEQVWQNYSQGKPLDDGVSQNAVLGMLSGAAMGSGANVLNAMRGDHGQSDAGLTNLPPAPPKPQASVNDILAATSTDQAISTTQRAVDDAIQQFTAPTSLTGTSAGDLLLRPDDFMAAVNAPRTAAGNTPADLLGSQPQDPLLSAAREGAAAREDQRQDDLAGQAVDRMRQSADQDNFLLKERYQVPVPALDVAIAAGDVLQKSGAPWPTQQAARLKMRTAKIQGELVPVEGGFLIRPSQGASNADHQDGAAGAPPVPAAAGTNAVGDGAVVPGAAGTDTALAASAPAANVPAAEPAVVVAPEQGAAGQPGQPGTVGAGVPAAAGPENLGRVGPAEGDRAHPLNEGAAPIQAPTAPAAVHAPAGQAAEPVARAGGAVAPADAAQPGAGSLSERWDAMAPDERRALVSRTAAKGKAIDRVVAKNWSELEPGWVRAITRVMPQAPASSESRAPQQSGPRETVERPAGETVAERLKAAAEAAPNSDKATRKKSDALTAQESARAEYFKPGNVVRSYGGFDEVLAYNAPKEPGGAWSVRVHEVKEAAPNQWVREGRPQDSRQHSTQPSAKELQQGPVAQLGALPAAEVPYSIPRRDGIAHPNAEPRSNPKSQEAPAAAKADKAEIRPYRKPDGSVGYEAVPIAAPAPAPASRYTVVEGNKPGRWLVRGDGGTNLMEFSLRNDGKPVAINHFFAASDTRRAAEKAMNDWVQARHAAVDRTMEKLAADDAAERAGAGPAAPAPSGNKIFTDDMAAAARARLKAKLGRTSAGLDPELIADGVVLAGFHIESGARQFAAFAKSMLDDMGEAIRPYIKSFYLAAKFDPRASEFSKEMSTAAFVEEFDLSHIAAPSDTGTVENGTAKPDTGETNGTATRDLEGPGPGALEGIPPADGQAPAGQRDAGQQPGRSGAVDQPGNAGPDESGSDVGRGVASGTGEPPVPPRGAGRGARSSGKRGVSDSGRSEREPGLFGDAGREGVGPQNPAPNSAPVPAPQFTPRDFTIADDFALGEGGQKAKFRNNIEAIRLAHEFQADPTRVATPAEQEALARYVGWGGLAQAFDAGNESWAKEHAELSGLLSPEEMDAARQSTRYAHYTSRPIIVDGIYAALRRFGFAGGRVLEGGAGVGNFIGLMPNDMRTAGRVTAVEREPLAATIARVLYPQQNVQQADFTQFAGNDGYFDAAVGNPPFASDPQVDQSGRKHLSGLSLHNYFFAKAVDMLREGGVLGQVVTNSFMDAAGDRARKYISDRTKFLGAIRLPNNAFSRNAGTEVTTDLIFLQKRPEAEWGSKAAREDAKAWLDTVAVNDPRKGVKINLNQYFVDHPEMMLGDWGAHGTMYGPDQPALIARPGQDTQALLREAVARLPQNVYQSRAQVAGDQARDAAVRALSAPPVGEGGYFVDEGGTLLQRLPDIAGEARGRELTPQTMWTEKTTLGDRGFDKLVRLSHLRTTLRSLLSAEMAGAEGVDALRKQLNEQYDAYAKEHGLLHDAATAKVYDDDPDYPLLLSLEKDYAPGVTLTAAKRQGIKPFKSTAAKSAIFTQRVVDTRKTVEHVDNPQDALAVSMAERGRLDSQYIAKLLGRDPDGVLRELSSGDKPLLFLDPASNEYVLRDSYLSGNVRAKLAQANAAGMTANARELEKVIPKDVGAHEIAARIGSPWVPESAYEDFAKDLFGEGTNASIKYVKLNSSYAAYIKAGSEVLANNRWGSRGYTGPELLSALLNNRTIRVEYRDDDRKLVLDKQATEDANNKAQEIKDRFQDWLFSDPDRSEILVRAYNDTNNNYATRSYDGSWMTFPGKVPDSIIKFRRHQRNAIARLVQDRTALLDHVVGAGKTFTIVSAAMEMRRTGLARKPMIAVPNHLVNQWAADFYRLYPGANILTATKKDFERVNRRRFLAKIATGDWDAVIIAHSSFGFIRPAPDFESKFNERQIAMIVKTIQDVNAGDGSEQQKKRTVKQLEGMKERLQNRIKALRDKAMDDLLDFDQIGVDQLFIDEAHLFKNLMFTTKMQNVAGLGDGKGSQRAYDMYVKSQEVMEKNGRGQGLVFATGTPVSNSLAEQYHMMRYLMPRQMEELGFQSFDAWANTFAAVDQVWMQKASGDGYKPQNRMGTFVNVHELLKMFDQVADTVTNEDIKKAYREENDGKEFPIPPLKTGRRQPVSLDKSPALEAYMQDIAQRAAAIEKRKGPPKKGEDNILTVMTDARKAAMDMRLVDMDMIQREPGGRIDRAAKEIVDRYHQYDHVKGAQLVFSDLGTPKKYAAKELKEYQALQARVEAATEDVQQRAALGAEEAQHVVDDAEAAQRELDEMGPDWLDAVKAAMRGFSVYDDLKQALVDSGIPEHEIAFIHDANTDERKSALFRKVNAGQVRVLMGSTPKMGAGTNVQERLVAEHHLDVPWKPSDVEQREGRIERQGNVLLEQIPGFNVEILAYVTKDTLDMRMWQIQEVKLKIINQLRTRQIARDMDNAFEDLEMSAGEMQAAATGNMDLLREIQMRTDIKKLEGKRRGFEAQANDLISRRRRVEEDLQRLPQQIERGKTLAEGATQYAKTLQDAGSSFKVTIDGKEYTDPSEAGKLLLEMHDARVATRTVDKDGKKVREELPFEQYQAMRTQIESMRAAKVPEDDPKLQATLADYMSWKESAAPLDVNVNGQDYTSRAKLQEAWSIIRGDREPIAWTLDGQTLNRRSVIESTLQKAIAEAVADEKPISLGKIGPFEVTAEGQSRGKERLLGVTLTYKDAAVDHSEVVPTVDEPAAALAKHVVQWADRRVLGLQTDYRYFSDRLEEAKKAKKEIEDAGELGKWPDQGKLDEMRARHRELVKSLNGTQEVPMVNAITGERVTVIRGPYTQDGDRLAMVRRADGTEHEVLWATLAKPQDPQASGPSDATKVAHGISGAGNDTDVVFDQGEPLTQASRASIGKIQQFADSVAQHWAKAPDIITVKDINSQAVPAAVRAEAQALVKRGGNPPRGVLYDGRVYLFADRISDERQALRVLLHEVEGHIGLRGAFGKDMVRVLNQVATARRSDVVAMMVKNGFDQSLPESSLRAAEEVLAEMAEKNPQLSIVQRAIAAVRNWLREHVPGFAGMGMTDNDIVQAFLIPAREFVRGGGQAAGTGAAFSQDQRTVQVDGMRHPDTNSRGQPITPTFQGQVNFWRWFDGSKVVDESGRPLVAVHLTNSDFNAFDHQERYQAMRDERGLTTSYGRDFVFPNKGFFFFAGNVPDRGTREAIAMPTYVRIANPLDFRKGLTGEQAGMLIDHFKEKIGSAGSSVRGDVIGGLRNARANGLTGQQVWEFVNHHSYGFRGRMYDEILDTLGMDGVMFESNSAGTILLDAMRGRGDGKTYLTVVPREPNQIKSAIGNNGQFDPESGDITFSQSAGDVTARTPSDYWNMGKSALHELGNTPGKLHWWHKTIGTQYNLAQRNRSYKRVFDRAQDFINDVSRYASETADLAPNILPKLESWKDMLKAPVKAGDSRAISAPIFEGTLAWTRDENGKPVRVDDMQSPDSMDADQKAQAMIRAGKISPDVIRMWRGQKLDQYQQAVATAYENRMMEPGIVWTPAELKSQFGLNDEQIGLYKQFRSAVDKSIEIMALSDMVRYSRAEVPGIADTIMDMGDLRTGAELINQALADKIQEEPEREDVLRSMIDTIDAKRDRARDLMAKGYAPLSRFGHYYVDITAADGTRLYFGMAESRFEAARVAKRMTAALADDNPGMKVRRGTLSQEDYKLFAGVSPETIELFGTLLGLESTGDSARDRAFQAYLRLAYSNRSSMKRLIHRKGIAGFSEDVGRVLAGFVYSNARQTSKNLHMGEMERMASEVGQGDERGDGELRDQAIRLVDYLKNPVEEAHALRGLLFAQYLGGNIASALVNMSQPFQITLPYLSQYGGVAAAGRRMAGAVRVAWAKTTGDTELDKALLDAVEKGIVAPQEVHQLLAQAKGSGALKAGDGTTLGNAAAATNNALARLQLGWGKMFSTAELFNRRVTFVAAWKTAKEMGIPDPFDFAVQAVDATQFVYNKGNKPQWARGAVGSVLFTFKQYSISYLELMSRMWTAGEPGSPERAAGRRAVLFAAAMIMLMGGAGGLPFATDAEDLVDGVMQRLGYDWSTKQKRRELLDEAFGRGLGHVLETGVSGLPGVPIDVAGRFGMGNLIPGTGLLVKKDDHGQDMAEMLGPVADVAKRFGQAGEQAARGNVINAGLMTSPTAIQNLAKAIDMASSGIYKDQAGRKVLDVDAYDALAKGIGFNPSAVATVQQATSATQQMVNLARMAETDIVKDWAQAMVDGDQAGQQAARDAIAEWNEKNPDTPIKVKLQQVLQRAKMLRLPKEQRVLNSAPKEVRAEAGRLIKESEGQ